MLISHNSKSSEQAIILLYFLHIYICIYIYMYMAHLILLCFILLHFTDTEFRFFSFLFLFLTNWKSVKQPCLEQVYRLHFPIVFAYYSVSLCHTLVILKIFQNFQYFYICYGDLRSIIFDVTTTTHRRLRCLLAFFSDKVSKLGMYIF